MSTPRTASAELEIAAEDAEAFASYLDRNGQSDRAETHRRLADNYRRIAAHHRHAALADPSADPIQQVSTLPGESPKHPSVRDILNDRLRKGILE